MSDTIEVTVKTMDSQSRKFTVPVDIKVKDFKETISPQVGVPASQQRLIFCGRVLADDFKLTREHHEKSVHLVQRMPPITTSNQTRSTSTTSSTGTSTNTTPITGFPGQNVFNPAQLSQTIFDQLFFGTGGLMEPGAPGVPGGAVPVPLPGQMNPGMGGNFVFDVGQRNPQQRAPGAQVRPVARHTVSAPRRVLATANQYLNQLEIVLARLESDHADSDVTTTSATTPAPDVNVSAPPSEENILEGLDEEVAETGQDQPNDSQNNSQPTTSAATGNTRTCANHPSLRELGQVYERLSGVQRRLQPHIEQMIVFFNTDPPFTNTQSSEFRYTTRWLGNTLRAQQLLAEVQRVLSHAVIPLGRTPPRSFLVQAQRPNRGNPMTPTPHPVVTPGAPNQNRAPGFPPRMMAWQPGVPGGAHRPRMVSVSSTVPQVFQGSVNGTPVRFRTVTHTVNGGTMNARNNQRQQARNPVTATPINNIASAATVPSPQPQPTPNTATSAATNIATRAATSNAPATSQATAGPNMVGNQPQQPVTGSQFTVAPPTYNVQINATIVPRVQIQVNPVTGETPNPAPQPTPAPINVSIAPSSATSSESGVIANNTAITGSTDNNINVNGSMPNVPGIPQELMSSIFQNVAQSLQGEGGNTAGVTIVQSPDQNIMSDEISNMLSQSVWNVTNNVLSGEFNVPQTTANSSPQNAANSTPQNAANSTPQNTASATPQTTASTTVPQTAATLPQTSLCSVPQTSANILPQTDNSLLVIVLGEVLSRLGLPRFSAPFVECLSDDVSVFEQLLDPLRSRVRELFFGGVSPSREEIQTVSLKLSDGMSDSLADMFADASVRQGADIVESNLSLVRHSVRRTFEILFLTSESDFPRQFQKLYNQTVGLFVQLNEHLLVGGLADLAGLMEKHSKKDSVLGKFLKLVFSETKDVTGDLATLVVTFPARLSQVEPFIVSPPPANAEPNVSMETSKQAEKEDKQPQGGDKGKEKKEKDPDSWKSEVPSDWVDVIAKDIEKQKGIPPQPPFSEAYVAGMPASKRRKVVS